MQFKSQLAMLVCALTAHAAALPTNTTVEKRNPHSEIGGFSSGQCTGQPDFPATRGNQDCQRFMTVSDNIGINWGDWPLDMAGLYVYKDAECKEYASQMIAAPEWDDAVGMNTCISQRQNGGPWQSIRFSGDGQ